MSRLINYFKDTRVEMKHVSWPTQRQALVYTLLIIGISAAVAVLLGVTDFLFTKGIEWFIS